MLEVETAMVEVEVPEVETTMGERTFWSGVSSVVPDWLGWASVWRIR